MIKYTLASSPDEAAQNFKNYPEFAADSIPALLNDGLPRVITMAPLPAYIYRGTATPMTDIKYYVWIDEPINFGRGRIAASIGFDAVPAGSSYPAHGTPWQRPYSSAAECLEGNTEWKLFPVIGIWDNTGHHWHIEEVK